MTDEGEARFFVADEVEQFAETLDKILDNIDRVNVKNWGKIAERLHFSKINVNQALAFLNEGSDEQENEQETEEAQESAPQRRFMRANEAANYLKISPRVLRVMAKNGDVPCQMCKNGPSGRLSYFFSQSALDEWLNE